MAACDGRGSGRRRRGRAGPGLTLVAVLAVIAVACTRVNQAVCPRVAVLDQAGSVTKFVPGGSGGADDVIVQAEMVGVELDCVYRGDDQGTLESNFRIEIAARRGPALRGDSLQVAYFVVVADRAGNVLNKRVFPLTLDFGSRPTLRLKEHTWQQYDLRSGGSGSSYEIWTGFQLSDAELRFNRER